jgi:sugar lactone lactonase YvrE
MNTSASPQRSDRAGARPGWAWPGATARLAVGVAVLASALGLPTPAQAGPGSGPAPTANPTRIYVTDHSPPDASVNGMVLEIDPGDGTRTLVSDNHSPVGGPDLQSPHGIALDADGNLIVAEKFTQPINGVRVPSIIRIDRATGVRTLVSSNTSPAAGPDLGSPTSLAIEADGDIVVADSAAFPQVGGGLIRVDPVTGARTTVSRNGLPAGGAQFDNPSDVAVAANGDLYVVDMTGVLRVDPVTGARTRVSRNNSPAGAPTFVNPSYLTIDTDGDVLVSDGLRILRVDPVTGVRTIVSDNASPPGGPAFLVPGDLAVDCDDILVMDTVAGVLRVDKATGVRTTVSDGSAPGPGFGFAFGIAVEHATRCPTTPLP